MKKKGPVIATGPFLVRDRKSIGELIGNQLAAGPDDSHITNPTSAAINIASNISLDRIDDREPCRLPALDWALIRIPSA